MDLARRGEKLANRSTGGERGTYPEHEVVPDGGAGEPRVVADELWRQLVPAGLRRRRRREDGERDEQRAGGRAPHLQHSPRQGTGAGDVGEAQCSGQRPINCDVPTTGTSFTFTEGLRNELLLLGGGGSCNLDAACDYAYDIGMLLAAMSSSVSPDLEPTGKGDPCVRPRYFTWSFLGLCLPCFRVIQKMQ